MEERRSNISKMKYPETRIVQLLITSEGIRTFCSITTEPGRVLSFTLLWVFGTILNMRRMKCYLRMLFLSLILICRRVWKLFRRMSCIRTILRWVSCAKLWLVLPVHSSPSQKTLTPTLTTLMSWRPTSDWTQSWKNNWSKSTRKQKGSTGSLWNQKGKWKGC